MSAIRVNYSGLISFVVSIGAIILGLIFTMIITRRLEPEEFGAWALILSLVNYFLISGPIVSYWTTRQIARGENIGKTSVISSLILSLITLPFFIIYVYFISKNTSVEFEFLLLGLILLPLNFASQTLNAINIGYKPQTVSYVQIIFDAIKIPAAIIFIIIFDLGVEGAIFALLLALISKIFFQSYFAREKLKDSFSFKMTKKWFKQFWIPTFGQMSNYLQLIDVSLYSILTGYVLGIAYYQAAFTLGLLVANAGAIYQALYPKILADKNFDSLSKNITYVLYFAIPLLAISILFAKPGLYALNPEYQNAWFIVILLSLKLFLRVLWTIPAHILQGMEQIDTQTTSFLELLKSKLFRIPAFASIFYLIYLSLLVILFMITKGILNELDVVMWWGGIGLIIELCLTIYFWIYAKKHIQFSFPYARTIKFILPAIIFSIVFLITSNQIIVYEPSIYKFLPPLLIELVICIIIYISITYIIDSEIRSLFKSIIKEIKKF